MDELFKNVATSALHDTSTRQNDDTEECNPMTRQLLLQQLIESPVFAKSLVQWFWGPAGAGKTSIMRSLARRLEERGEFLAGFYFWRSDGSRNNLKALVTTLAFQIAENDQSTLPHIEEAMTGDRRIFTRSTKTQMEKLVIKPLLSAHRNNTSASHPRVIVIDGLDECDSGGQREFLEDLLPTLVSRLSDLRITIFVSSRPEPQIDSRFSHPRLSSFTNRIFLEPSKEDVRQFLGDAFDEINRCHPELKKKYNGRWPIEEDVEILKDKSSGYFILAKTAIRYINPDKERGRAPDQRLRDILEAFRADPLRPLDTLYLFILRQNAPEDATAFGEWKTFIGRVCLPVQFFRDFVEVFGYDDTCLIVYGQQPSKLQELVRELGSIFYIDERTGQVQNYHASFPDCIFNPERSAEFAMDPGHLHELVASGIIKTISTIPNYLPSGKRACLQVIHIANESLRLQEATSQSEERRGMQTFSYRSIMRVHLPQHLQRLSAVVAGGHLDKALEDIGFRQLLSNFHKFWTTLTLSALMWTSLYRLFQDPHFKSIWHHRVRIMTELRIALQQYLDAVTFDEGTDYVSLLCLLGRFCFKEFSITPLLSHSRSALLLSLEGRPSMVSKAALHQDLYESYQPVHIDGFIGDMVDSIGISRLSLFFHFLDDNLGHRCVSLFMQESAPPESDWLSLNSFQRAGFHVFLLMHSVAHQDMLTRIWAICNLRPSNDPTSISFHECRLNERSFARKMSQSTLQYFYLCKQAGMRPEGISESQEDVWLSWSTREPLPAGCSTVADSFDLQSASGNSLLPNNELVHSAIKVGVEKIPGPSSVAPSSVTLTRGVPKHDSEKKRTKRDRLKQVFGWRP